MVLECGRGARVWTWCESVDAVLDCGRGARVCCHTEAEFTRVAFCVRIVMSRLYADVMMMTCSWARSGRK